MAEIGADAQAMQGFAELYRNRRLVWQIFFTRSEIQFAFHRRPAADVQPAKCQAPSLDFTQY
jgi:hypothetical protein